MSRRGIAVACLTAAAASAAVALGVTAPGAAGHERHVSAASAADWRWYVRAPEQIKWTKTPYGWTTTLWGDPRSGAYGSFNRFPAGQVIPKHTHSNGGHVVVVSGILYNYRSSERPRPYSAGAYLSEAPNIAHTTRCGTSGECIVYVHQDAPLDFKPVKP